jgi:hypothetical protein
MSDFDVYDNEMLNNRFSDQDVESLLSGQMPEDEDLARLAPIVEALHGRHRVTPSKDGVARFAARAAEIAISTRPAPAGTAVPARATTRSRRFVLALRTKMATGLAALLLLSGMTGVAVASNGAAPGGILYGIDQALEAIGIGDGGAEERIAEAQALFNDGQVAEALAHAALAVEVDLEGDSELENIEVMTAEEATDALLAVVEKLTLDEIEANEYAAIVVSNVADLLNYIATTEDTGSTFGENVASMARDISPAPEELPDTAEEAAENGAENSDNAAEESEDAEPPDEVPAGPPDSVPPTGP